MYLSLDEKGLTLVEIIVTIAIFGILLVPVLGLQSNNIKLNIGSNQQNTATNIAEGKLEELKYIDITEMKFEEKSTNQNGFEIITKVDKIDRKDITEEEKEDGINFNELYKLKVVVIKDDKVIEELTTYRNSLERSD